MGPRLHRLFALVRWELRRHYHSYIVEIIMTVTVYNFFQTLSNPGFSVSLNTPLAELQARTASSTSRAALFTLLNFFYVAGMIAGIVASSTFTSEIESGLAKTYLSHPLGRGTYLLGKSLASYIVLSLSIFTALLYGLLFFDTRGAFNMLASLAWTSGLVAVFIMSLLILVPVVAIAIFSKNSWISAVSSIGLMYGLQIATQVTRLEILPSTYFQNIIFKGFEFFFTSSTSILYVLVYGAIAVLAYIFFSRRVETA